MKLTDTHYEQFAANERVTLFWEAIGRRDFSEVGKLIATCPRKAYSMEDAAYIETVRGIHLCCLHVLLLIQEHTRAMMTAIGLLALIDESHDKELRKLVSKTKDAYRSAAGAILGVWEAWCDFCKSRGVDPEAVMRSTWCVPEWTTKPPLGEAYGPVEVNAAAKSIARDLLHSIWEPHGREIGPEVRYRD